MTLALLFPGQGSQYIRMGRELAVAEPAATRLLAKADEILGFPLSSLMAEGPEDVLTATNNAQPAILVHSLAALEVARERIGPVALAAGHSLGEFTAHVAAETMSFEEALLAVRHRGELMHRAGQEKAGTMAAILGLDDSVVEKICQDVDAGVCQIGNLNSKGQVVISGDISGVEEGMELAKEAGAKKVVQLNVSGAFHSTLMEPAASGLRERLEEIDFVDPVFPVVSNVTAELVTTGEVAKDLLVRQVTAPVRSSASISTMLASGADQFLELGPGRGLKTLNRRNAQGCESMAFGEPDDFAALETLE